MGRTLMRLAWVIVLGCLGYWAIAGANLGWTKTSAAFPVVDPVTGIETVEYRPRFLPGVDFLGLVLLASAALAAVACVHRKPKNLNPQP